MLLVVRYAVVPCGTRPVTTAVVVEVALPPFIGDTILAGEDTTADPLLSRPFGTLVPLAVKITVPLLIFPIGGMKRFSLTLFVTLLPVLLGIKLIALLLLLLFVCTLLVLLLVPFCCCCVVLDVGIIETSLLNLCDVGR